jgi:hypothetical protein
MNRLFKSALIFVLMIPGLSNASGVTSGTITEISFTSTMPNPLNTATVTASLDPARQRISTLEVKLGKEQIAIPRKAFEDLPSPKLHTMRLTYSGGSPGDKDWYVVLGFDFGDPVCDFAAGKCEEGKDWFSSIEIMIEQNHTSGRWIYRAEGEGSTKFDPY